MTIYSIAEAEAGLPALIDRALAGEEVVIAREGRPVARLHPTLSAKEEVIGSHEWLFSRRAKPAPGAPTSVELLNLIYEDGGV
jgi:antitoxin (DNA-binding transcriptional repressor) of toxin-antitoxin stability system